MMTEELWDFFGAGARRVGFPSSYERELREPLVWPQGSPVSIRVARGSVALLSSHGRRIGPHDALKGDLELFLELRQETLGSLDL